MRYFLFFTLGFLLVFPAYIIYGQQDEQLTLRNSFRIKGTVRYKQSYVPIEGVVVFVNGGSYTTTDPDGNFNIIANIGDQLTFEHKDLETVYHTVTSNDRLVIEVAYDLTFQNKPLGTSRKPQIVFNSLIDSVNAYLKLDIERSLNFATDALQQSSSAKDNAEAYEILGDVYMYWGQYDLAIFNYKVSLQNKTREGVKIKIGSAYRKLTNFQESILSYNKVNKQSLSNWEKVLLYEGYGDTYLKQRKFDFSIINYKEALKIAEINSIVPMVTNLTSKTAKAFAASGSKEDAKTFFSSAMGLAANETIERSIEERITIADFHQENRDYSEGIQLRKEALVDIEKIQLDSVLSNASSLTPQKQNYKIGTAYYLNKDNEMAINYLEKSIEEAEVREDLVVKKDGLKKLSDVYVDKGDFIKAKEIFEEYISTVDELYIKREQEISQAARFSRKIAENQSRINSLEMDKRLSESVFQLSEERGKRQEYIIYSLIAGLILVLALTYVMYKYIRQQKFANNLLALKSLRSQMNPHFIFNALNSVNSFIALNDERTANKYLSDFSFLMRAVLENSEEDFISLRKEIELIELYAKLEHFRFKEKFDYLISIDDNVEIDEYEIPPMLLQPYIENAVWHGLRYKEVKGFLKINFKQEHDELLTISITDNGIGRSRSKELKTENQRKHNPQGLLNIKKRISILNRMYKDKIDVSVSNYDEELESGTRVIVTLKKN